MRRHPKIAVANEGEMICEKEERFANGESVFEHEENRSKGENHDFNNTSIRSQSPKLQLFKKSKDSSSSSKEEESPIRKSEKK